jgi:hypothetical protein
MPKLTPEGEVVLEMLKDGEWWCAEEIGVSLSLLRSLVKKGYLEERSLGYCVFNARRDIEFRLKQKEE